MLQKFILFSPSSPQEPQERDAHPVLERDTQRGYAAPALVFGLAQLQVPLRVHDVESGLGANSILRLFDKLAVYVLAFSQERLCVSK